MWWRHSLDIGPPITCITQDSRGQDQQGLNDLSIWKYDAAKFGIQGKLPNTFKNIVLSIVLWIHNVKIQIICPQNKAKFGGAPCISLLLYFGSNLLWPIEALNNLLFRVFKSCYKDTMYFSSLSAITKTLQTRSNPISGCFMAAKSIMAQIYGCASWFCVRRNPPTHEFEPPIEGGPETMTVSIATGAAPSGAGWA